LTTLRDDLHWLPIKQRVDFKVSVITYRCMHGTALEYLTEDAHASDRQSRP